MSLDELSSSCVPVIHSRSPYQVLDSILRLGRLAFALDTGSYFSSQSVIILYVLRLLCNVESYVGYLVAYARKEQHPGYRLRDTPLEAAVVEFLEAQRSVV